MSEWIKRYSILTVILAALFLQASETQAQRCRDWNAEQWSMRSASWQSYDWAAEFRQRRDAAVNEALCRIATPEPWTVQTSVQGNPHIRLRYQPPHAEPETHWEDSASLAWSHPVGRTILNPCNRSVPRDATSELAQYRTTSDYDDPPTFSRLYRTSYGEQPQQNRLDRASRLRQTRAVEALEDLHDQLRSIRASLQTMIKERSEHDVLQEPDPAVQQLQQQVIEWRRLADKLQGAVDGHEQLVNDVHAQFDQLDRQLSQYKESSAIDQYIEDYAAQADRTTGAR